MKKMTEHEMVAVLKANEPLLAIMDVIGTELGKHVPAQYDGFVLQSANSVMMTICSDLPLEDLGVEVNKQVGGEKFNTDFGWIPMVEDMPSGDKPRVPCGDGKGRSHQVFQLDHPIAEALIGMARLHPELNPNQKKNVYELKKKGKGFSWIKRD